MNKLQIIIPWHIFNIRTKQDRDILLGARVRNCNKFLKVVIMGDDEKINEVIIYQSEWEWSQRQVKGKKNEHL